MTTFTDAIAELNTNDAATFLGRVCWFSVSDDNIPHELLADEMKAAGLEEWTPAPPRDDDVFRRVFKNGERRKVATSDSNITEKILIREVLRQDGEIVKRVVIEKVDANDRDLDYNTDVLELTFTAAHPDNIAVKPLGSLHPQALALVGGLSKEYRETRGMVTGQAVRDVMRKAFEGAYATQVRQGGGVYFVMETRADVVTGLEHLAAIVKGAEFVAMPLIDEGKQRDMVQRAFEAETIGEVDKTIGEIAEMLKAGDKVTPKRFASMSARYRELQASAQEYSKVLERGLNGTEHKLDILKREMAALHGRISTGGNQAAA